MATPAATEPKTDSKTEQKEEYLIGTRGITYIRQALSTQDPRKFVELFQEKQQLKVPGSSAALQFLQVLGVRRADVYGLTLTHLVNQLVTKIPSMTREKQALLLERSFAYISVEELRAIPVTILMTWTTIPKKYLMQLGTSKLTSSLPLPIQQRVWELYPNLFLEQAKPVIEKFVHDKERIRAHHEYYWKELSSHKKRRDHDAALSSLTSLIGTSQKLYETLIGHIRTSYTSSGDISYCILRLELLMSLHDNNTPISTWDTCHNMAWCMDACIRDGKVSEAIMEKMQSGMKGFKSGPQVADLAMLISHPSIQHVILDGIVAALSDVVEQESVPKEHSGLRFLSDLITLSVNARPMLQTNHFTLPHTHPTIFNEFYPLLAELLMLSLLEETEALNPNIKPYMQDEMARRVLLFYLIHRLRNRDIARVIQLLPLLNDVDDPVPVIPFIQSYVSEIIPHKDLLKSDQQLRKSTFDSLLIPLSGKWNQVHGELLRLLIAVVDILPTDECMQYITVAQSMGSTDERTLEQLRQLTRVVRLSHPQLSLTLKRQSSSTSSSGDQPPPKKMTLTRTPSSQTTTLTTPATTSASSTPDSQASD